MMRILIVTTLLCTFIVCAGQPDSSRMNVSVRLDSLLDKGNPKISIIYSNVKGERAIRLLLPNVVEIPAFRELTVTVDGKEAVPLIDVSQDNIAFSRKVDLRPGESTEVQIELSKIYKLSANWSNCKIVPNPQQGTSGCRVSILIEDSDIARPHAHPADHKPD